MERQPTSSNPSDDAIEAIIQQATSAAPYSRPGGPLRDTRTQLFVGNLPYRVRWQDLKDLFRKAGTVLRADVSLGPDNRSRGYGTVLLATAEDAGRAVDTFNGYSWQSRILEVRLDRQLQDFDSPTPSNSSYLSLLISASKSSSVTDDPDYPPSVTDPNSRRNLFVGNLPFHCQWQDLKDLFRQAGTITRADVVLGPDGRSRGFGTVVFATELDAERALKMFNGYEFSGRVLNVHRDKFSFSNHPENASTSPVPGSSSGASSLPTHITLPPGYMFDLLPSSGPTSPHEMFNYQHHHHLHDQQQLHLQLQQHQHRLQHQQHPKHQQQQQRNPLYDTLDHENLPDASPSILRSGASSTQFHDFLPPSSSLSSRPPSTSAASISTKHPIPIPIYKPPSLSHTNTASSGSDRSEMFSRLSSTSVTSAASSVSSSLSRPHSQSSGYSHGQVPGQGQRARGQPFQTSSPHPAESPESPHHSHSGSQHHSSSSSHSSSPHASQFSSSYTTSTCRSSSRPPSSNPNHRPPQRPGPISLPPPLLPSQIAFNYPLQQQFSPHVHTPLGMSVSVSMSPLVEYSGGFGYPSGMYGQQQQQLQFGQHMTPNGLPMTPSMPPFFLPPTMASGSHVTPTGASMRVGTGSGSSSSGGHRHTHSRSKSLARHLEGELGSVSENTRSNANASVNDRTSSPSASPPPSSSARQRHHHQQHHHHHQNQQPSQPSYHQNRRSAGGVGSSPNAQPIPNASNTQLQPISMHINLSSIPGAFSPGVVMSPGTFYGRPGEVPTFINAAVGAPLAMQGGGADMSEAPAGAQEQTQAQQGQGQGQAGQWYQNQTHGSYFYAMSSPRRRTPTGMEPKGYFDPLFFPVGVNVCDGGGGGYSSSVGGSGALVNEIMKDGRAESLGVEMGKEEGRGKGMKRKGEGEEEMHISDDGDDEKDSGDDADVDDDDSGEQAEEEENQEAHDTDPSFNFRG